MVDGGQLRGFRGRKGWTQQQAAARLGVTQAYLSMLERGRREVPQRLLPALVRLFDLAATALPLPPAAKAMTDTQLAGALAALGYPGFRHLAATTSRLRNPAEVLAAALCRPQLDARTVEALPWLVLEYSDLDWDWLVREVKLRDRQNRLGYVVELTRQLAEKAMRADTARRLRDVVERLESSRLAREGSFAGETLSEAERRWLRQMRPAEARHWNLLTDLRVEQLQYAH